jgi:hypothetical protein
MSSLYESVFIEKIPYWVFALSVLGLAATSIGLECIDKCKCKGRNYMIDNWNYLLTMSLVAGSGIILSGFEIFLRNV